MSAPCIFFVKALDFSKFIAISESAPERLPDSSPALTMDTKSLEKMAGNFARAAEKVSPEFMSLVREVKIFPSLEFLVCFFKTDNALERERPALTIPLRFFAKTIFSSTLTVEKTLYIAENL